MLRVSASCSTWSSNRSAAVHAILTPTSAAECKVGVGFFICSPSNWLSAGEEVGKSSTKRHHVIVDGKDCVIGILMVAGGARFSIELLGAQASSDGRTYSDPSEAMTAALIYASDLVSSFRRTQQ